MTNNKIIKEVFKDFGESVDDLTVSQLIAINEAMNIARQDKANRVIKEIEKRTLKIGFFNADEERTKNIILKYGI